MKLYHYTKPGNVMMISGQGLQPRAHENNAHMTGGVPVVWLTAEPSIIVTEADIAHMMRAVGHTGDKKLGDLYFGGPARLTVELPRHDKRLARYADFMRKRLNRLSEGLNPDGSGLVARQSMVDIPRHYPAAQDRRDVARCADDRMS